MGLHSPFGYVGYEVAFAKAAVYLLDNFCSGCHPNEDFPGGCADCPIGNLIIASRKYLEDIWEGSNSKEKQLMRKMKQEAKNLAPHPVFNSDFIFAKKRAPDTLAKLRELIADLEFENEKIWLRFNISHKIKIRSHRAKQFEKDKKKLGVPKEPKKHKGTTSKGAGVVTA